MTFFNKLKFCIASLAIITLVGFAASEPVEPEILELEDNFNNTYNTSESPVSDQELVFDGKRTLELCVSELRHSEDANLSFYYNKANPDEGLNEDNCHEQDLSRDNYTEAFVLPIRVTDHNHPYNATTRESIQYTNTTFPFEGEVSNSTVTEYDNVLIDRERYESIQEENQRLRDENEDLTSQLESKNNTIESLENEIEELEEELRGFREGLTSWINRLF